MAGYPSYIGRSKALDFVDYDPMLEAMGGKRREQVKRYRAFVERGLRESDQGRSGRAGRHGVPGEDFKTALKESPHAIGGEQFRAGVADLYRKLVETHKRPEDVAFRRAAQALSPDTVLDILAETVGVGRESFLQRRRNSPWRAIAARVLVRFSGLTQREIADRLKMGTGGAVSAQIRRLPSLLAVDRRLCRSVAQAEARLGECRGGKGGTQSNAIRTT